MAETDFPTLPGGTDEGADWTELFDTGQLDNFVIGINGFADGFTQAWHEVREAIGLDPEGTTAYVTQEMEKERKILREAAHDDQKLTGAAGVEFVGETLPLFLVGAGATVARAAALGGAASAGFYHDNPEETSRLGDMALGALGGGLFRTLIRGGGAAAEKAKQTIEDVQKRLSGPGNVPRIGTPRAQIPHQPMQDLGKARIVPDGELGGRVPQTTNLLPAPRPAMRGRSAADSIPPNASQTASAARTRAIHAAQTLDPKKAEIALLKANKRAKEASEKLAKIDEWMGKAKSPKAMEGLLRRRATLQGHRVVANTMIKTINELFKKRAAAGGSKREVTSRVEKAQRSPVAEGVAQRVQRQTNLGTKKDMAADIKLMGGPDLTDAQVRKLTKPQLEAMTRGQAQKTLGQGGSPGRSAADAAGMANRQGGFIANDMLNTVGGAVGGAVGMGALTDGDPIAMAAGAIGGGAAFRAMGRRLDKVKTNKQREDMRKASQAGSDYNENVSRAVKAKDFSMETLSKIWTSGRNVLDQYLGSTMTRLELLAPRIANALRHSEFQQHQISQQWMSQGDELFKRIDAAGLTDVERNNFNIALLNSTDRARNYLRSIGKTDAADAITDFEGVLAEVGQYLGQVDLGKNLRSNYFPRMVKDISYFDKIEEVNTYLDQLAKKKGVKLTDYEREIAITEIINGALTRGNDQTHFGRAASNLKNRTVKVDQSNIGAYADPREGFNDYIESITTQVERRKFFQGQGVKVDDLGPNAENIETVAGRLAKQLTGKELTPDEVDEVAQLIRMRFGPGEQAPHKAVQTYKNLTYAGLLGNPLAAMTQLGDLALGMHRNGIANTVSAIVDQMGRKGRLADLDKETLLGIRNAASDFASRTSSRDLLNWSLRYSGFQAADRFGKNTFIKGAMLKNQKMSPAEFKQKWGKIFDPDAKVDPKTGQLATPRTDELFQQVQGFKKIDASNRENIGFMLWNELEGVQPISLSALPQRYLQHPNGRMAYMLQSFTLKLFDVMRKDIGQEIAKGNYIQATKNATKLTSLFVTLNGGVDAAKNFILNKDQPLPEVVLNNFMKMGGFNKYMFDNIGREGLGSTVLETMAPPTTLIDAVTDPRKALQQVPLGGKIAESRME